MRTPFRIQLKLHSIPVSEVEIPTDSRHTIYPILRAMQELFPHRHEITKLIVEQIVDGTASHRGAPGMTGWQILMMVALRLHKSYSFDDLEVEFNENKTVRAMLELDEDDETRFSSKTLSENFRKLTPETLDACGEFVLKQAMHRLGDDGKIVRADSFACQVDIHYPTDQYLVFDAARKVLEEGYRVFDGGNGWRQSKSLIKKLKMATRKVAQSKRGGGKGKDERIQEAYEKLLERARHVLELSIKSMDNLSDDNDQSFNEKCSDLWYWTLCLDQAFSQAFRRIILNEKIENSEKLLSIFETHTELINRGKFPNPVEFGHRVVVTQSGSGLVTDYRVMDKGTVDRDEVRPLLLRLKEKYGKLKICSLDKGYWHADVYSESKEEVENLVLPKKGKASQESFEREHDPAFVASRLWRAGVESLISSLQRVNGLDKCRDRGYQGYLRWVSAGILTRNLITFGEALLEEEREIRKAS